MGTMHTSVPRWPVEVPGVDTAGRAVTLLGFGTDGRALVHRWTAEVAAGTPVDVRLAGRADEETLAGLADRVAGAVVGWRLMLAGPEVDVLAARAVAIAGGALDAELRVAVTGTEQKRVYCPHCRTTTTTTAPVAGETPCDGCGRRLHVYAHVSRRTGSYLGFLADAEEVR
jgi:phytoene/squalene synthetase